MTKTFEQFIEERRYYGIFDIVENDEEVRQNHEYIKKLVELLWTCEVEDVIKILTKQYKNVPKIFITFMSWFLTLLSNDEFEDKYSYFLIENSMLRPGSEEGMKYIKETRKELEKLVEKILKVDIDEFYEMNRQFEIGMKKYKENKEKSRIITDIDPYGEEEWGDESKEEQIRRAFKED